MSQDGHVGSELAAEDLLSVDSATSSSIREAAASSAAGSAVGLAAESHPEPAELCASNLEKIQSREAEKLYPTLSAVQGEDIAGIPPLTFPEGGKMAWMSVAGTWLVMVSSFGLLNTIGAIESYVAEHILVHNTTNEISWVFSIYCFITFGGGIVSGLIFDRYGVKVVCASGTVLLVGGMFATANCRKLWQFILAFGVAVGIGCGLVSTPAINSVGHYFQKKRGLAMGWAMSGASIGGVAWPLLCRGLYPKIGFSWTIRVLGFIFLGCMVAACTLLTDRHKEFRERQRLLEEMYGSSDSGEDVENRNLLQRFWYKAKKVIDFSLMRNVGYDLMVGALFMNEFSLVLIFTYIPSYAIAQGFGESLGLIALTVINAAGIPGRYFPPYMSDKIGNFNMMVICSAVMSVVILVLWVPFGQHVGAFFAFVVIYGFAVAGTLALTPLCTASLVEPRMQGQSYGTAYFFASWGNLLTLVVGSAISSTKGGYQAMAGFTGGTTVIATVLFAAARVKLAGWKRCVI